MFNKVATTWFRWLGGVPAFQVYGKARRETAWRIIDVFATHRRNWDSRWPARMWRGTCITWTGQVIAVGWDFAANVLREQMAAPASRACPVEVAGGRLHDLGRRGAAGAETLPSASEILAHECGHTGQALRFGWVYLPIGGLFTLFREGPRFRNWFENQASEQGLFGGIVNGSVHPELMVRLAQNE
jgi:hypothetical protein